MFTNKRKQKGQGDKWKEREHDRDPKEGKKKFKKQRKGINVRD